MESNIGPQIKKFRKAKKMTQEDLANLVGCATITIRQYENNSRTPNPKVLQKIAWALGCSMEDLIGVETFDTGEEFDARWEEFAKAARENPGGESLVVVYLTDPVKYINFALSRMNEAGLAKMAERAEELLEMPKYRKEQAKEKKDPPTD